MKVLKLQSLLLVTDYLLLLGHNVLFVQVVLLCHELIVLSRVVLEREGGHAHHVRGCAWLLLGLMCELIDQLVVRSGHEALAIIHVLALRHWRSRPVDVLPIEVIS